MAHNSQSTPYPAPQPNHEDVASASSPPEATSIAVQYGCCGHRRETTQPAPTEPGESVQLANWRREKLRRESIALSESQSSPRNPGAPYWPALLFFGLVAAVSILLYKLDAWPSRPFQLDSWPFHSGHDDTFSRTQQVSEHHIVPEALDTPSLDHSENAPIDENAATDENAAAEYRIQQDFYRDENPAAKNQLVTHNDNPARESYTDTEKRHLSLVIRGPAANTAEKQLDVATHQTAIGKRAMKLQQQGNDSQAAEIFKQAMRSEPSNIVLLENYANLMTRTGNYTEAEVYYKAALSTDKRLATYVDTLEDDTASASARVQYQRALDVTPTYAIVLDNYAILLAWQGRFIEARQHYVRSLRSMPNNPITHYNLACMWGREGNSTQSLQELKDAVDFGYEKYNHIESDSDFDSVRKERPNAFAKVMARLHEKLDAP